MKRMKRAVALWLVWAVILFPVWCGAQSSGFILLASTIGPIDSGIVDLLENEFEKETGIRVRHVGAGTGAALEIAKKGNVDLGHGPCQIPGGKIRPGRVMGRKESPLMYNDFVIVGPASDPAGIKGMKKRHGSPAKDRRERSVLFITRGDKSGTHVAEMEVWQKAGIKPSGSWYVTYEKGTEGNVPTLRYTDQKAGLYLHGSGHLSRPSRIKSNW